MRWNILFNGNYISSVLIEGIIYRLSKGSQYDKFKESINSQLIDIIESWHYCLVTEVWEERIWLFIFSSRFFRSIFTNEIWEIYPFLNNCIWTKCKRISDFLNDNKSFKNIICKYKPEQRNIPRKNLYLIRKESYPFLKYETCINISNITYIKKVLFESYKSSCAIGIESMWAITPWDKSMLIRQIELNLNEDKDIKSEASNNLRSLVEKWK